MATVVHYNGHYVFVAMTAMLSFKKCLLDALTQAEGFLKHSASYTVPQYTVPAKECT